MRLRSDGERSWRNTPQVAGRGSLAPPPLQHQPVQTLTHTAIPLCPHTANQRTPCISSLPHAHSRAGPGPSSLAAAAAAAAPTPSSRLTSCGSFARPQLAGPSPAPSRRAWSSPASHAHHPVLPSTCPGTPQPVSAAAVGAPAVAAAAGASRGSTSSRNRRRRGKKAKPAGETLGQQQDRDSTQGSSLLSAARGASNRNRQPQGSSSGSDRSQGGGGKSAASRPPQRQGPGPQGSDVDDDEDEGNEPEFMRLPDGRQVVLIKYDTKAALAAAALTHALGAERQAVVRFTGPAGGLSGLRVLTLAHAFMKQFKRGLNFMVDVREGLYSGVPYNPAIHGLKVVGGKRRTARGGARAGGEGREEQEDGAGAGRGKEEEDDEKEESYGAPPIWLAGGVGGNVSFDYRVMARARNTEPWEEDLQVGSRGYVRGSHMATLYRSHGGRRGQEGRGGDRRGEEGRGGERRGEERRGEEGRGGKRRGRAVDSVPAARASALAG